MCVPKKKNQCVPEPRVKVVPIKYASITPLNLLTFPLSTEEHTHTHRVTCHPAKPSIFPSLKSVFFFLSAPRLINKFTSH